LNAEQRLAALPVYSSSPGAEGFVRGAPTRISAPPEIGSYAAGQHAASAVLLEGEPHAVVADHVLRLAIQVEVRGQSGRRTRHQI